MRPSFTKLLETFTPDTLCPLCEVIRLPRSRHCNICNKCVVRYDHHCPWINNCVSQTNHFSFYMHLIFLLAYSIFVFSISLKSIDSVITPIKVTSYILLVVSVLFGATITVLFLFQTTNLCKGQTSGERYRNARY